ncbi:hypothetical protein Tco_0608736 [Tanacetum coccineum]
MTKKERESMLYDEFDKFTSEPVESIHSYYLRFAKLINDMNMIPMSMTPMQINTKFVNHLQPEWSRFVTTAKQARILHSVTFDQLYAFLKHNERDAKEVREMRQQFSEPLTWLANTYNLPPSYSINQTHYAPTVVPQPPTYQPDTRLAIPTFLLTDDPIASLNKDMIFLSSITQATIQNAQVTVQNVQGRQSQGYAGNARNNQASGARVINAVGNTGANQPRVIRCYNYKGEGVVLDKEKQDFLADSLEETDDNEDLQLHATTNFKAAHVDAYDSNCDDEATANAIFMENLSPVGSLNDDTVAPHYDYDTLSEVPYYDTYHDSDVLNSNIQELGYIENIVSTNESYDELKGNSDVISYTDCMLTIRNDKDNYVSPAIQKNDMMLVRVLGYAVKDGHPEQEAYLSRTKLYSVTPFPKSKVIPKVVEKNDLSKSVTSHLTTKKIIEKCTKVLALGLLKIETEPIHAYFKNNRAVHRDYLKVTKEYIATLQELLEQARALKPLDEHIGRVSSTNASGSKFRSNTKNDRIPQPSSRSMKNKVEAHHRKFKSNANKNNHVSNCNENVKNVVLSKNSDIICLSCNGCLFFVNHDACVVQYLNKMQKHKMAQFVKPKEKFEWKPTGRIFKTIGLNRGSYWLNVYLDRIKIVEIVLCYYERTMNIMEIMNIQFDELTHMDSEQYGSGPDLHGLTSGLISSGLMLNQNPSVASNLISAATLPPLDTAGASSSSTSIEEDAPSLTRLVAKGYLWEEGIDFEESFAPVARIEAI